MQTLTHFAKLEPDEDGSVIVTFPDVPEALTAGDDREEALANAADALGVDQRRARRASCADDR